MFRLKQLRESRNITQLKLAVDLNMNQNSISRYETGTHEADYKTLIAFADYFNVSIDYLIIRHLLLALVEYECTEKSVSRA